MRLIRNILLACLGLSAGFALAANAAPAASAQSAQSAQSVHIVIDDAATRDVAAADLADLPRHRIETLDHGQPAVFEGVALIDVLRLVGLDVGDKMHGPLLSRRVSVEAADGYRVVYALPELDTTIRPEGVFLIDHRDGHALSEPEGPWRLVAPGDRRAARWVRQVTRIRVHAP